MDLYNSGDKRRNARILIIQEYYAQSQSPVASITDLLTPKFPLDTEKFEAIKASILAHKQEIDEMILKFAKERPLDEINPVDYSILRVVIAEGILTEITPPKVAINEGIEIAKLFGTDASPKFVNGVLGAIYDEYKRTHEQVTENPKD
jgi:N utilization substance protein B